MKRNVLLVASCFLMATSTMLYAQRNSPPLPESVSVKRDLEYVTDGHERQRLDLYLPTDAKAPMPLIVWVHGGAWLGGRKEDCRHVIPFVQKGYAVASINYRLSQHAVFPAQIHDCKAAIRWLKDHSDTHGIDPNRIGVWGASAGGHLVALLGTSGDVVELEGDVGESKSSSRVQAVVDWFGPTDFTKMRGNHDSPTSPEAKLIGGPVQQNKDKAAAASPITYVSKDDPPFLIVHGDQDPTVPFHQSEILVESLRGAHLDVTFIPMRGAGHGGPQFQDPKLNGSLMKSIEDFFNKHLKKS